MRRFIARLLGDMDGQSETVAVEARDYGAAQEWLNAEYPEACIDWLEEACDVPDHLGGTKRAGRSDERKPVR